MSELTVLVDFDPGFPTPTLPVAKAGDYAALPFVPELLQCAACSCRSEARQVVPGTGPVTSPVMVIGQNPGVDEDRTGVPFCGAGGDELDRWLMVLGWDRAKILITNAVKCHTTMNRVPKQSELKVCTNLWLAKELAALPDLRVLIPVGRPAITAILGKSAPPLTPLMAHHFRVRVHGRELHVFPLPHPAFLLRAQQLGPLFQTVLSHVRLTLEQDLPEVCAAVRR